MIPHITNEIKARILALATDDVDVVITEIGGTVGDIEILPFLEAIRQFRNEVGRENVFYVHVTLVPYIGPSGEQKTKPTQHSVTELRSRGIQPDAIVCRSDRPIPTRLKEKISALCDVPAEGIVSAVDAEILYEIPLVLHDEGLDDYVCRVLHLDEHEPDLTEWRALVDRVRVGRPGGAHRPRRQVHQPARRVPLGRRGAEARRLRVRRQGRRSTGSRPTTPKACSPKAASPVSTASSCPAGSASAASRARSRPPRYAREHDVPVPRTVPRPAVRGHRVRPRRVRARRRELVGVRLADARIPVIDLMDEQKSVVDMGGTMRLGAYPAKLEPGSRVRDIYGEEVVYERHRHRYELNNRYRQMLEEHGMRCSGTSPDGLLVEFIELRRPPVLRRDAGAPRVQEPARTGRTRCSPRSSKRPRQRAEGRSPRLPIDTVDERCASR